MLIDLPPFIINPLDDQVLKSGKLTCYSDKARLHPSEDFAIKDGWLYPEAAKILPAGYYSLFDQNNLRLMDFENYCQTDQRELQGKLFEAKSKLQKIELPKVEAINADRKPLAGTIAGIGTVQFMTNDYDTYVPPLQDEFKFTQVVEYNPGEFFEPGNYNHDNGFLFNCKIPEISSENVRDNFINLTRILEAQKGDFWQPHFSDDFVVARFRGKYSHSGSSGGPFVDYSFIWLYGDTKLDVDVSNQSITLSRLALFMSSNHEPGPTGAHDPAKEGYKPITLTISNAFAPDKSPIELRPGSKIHRGIHYSASGSQYTSSGLDRCKDMPEGIYPSFRNRHKFYRTSEGKLLWGGQDFIMGDD